MELLPPSQARNQAHELVAVLGVAMDLVDLSGNAGIAVGRDIDRMPVQALRRMTRRRASQQRETTKERGSIPHLWTPPNPCHLVAHHLPCPSPTTHLLTWSKRQLILPPMSRVLGLPLPLLISIPSCYPMKPHKRPLMTWKRRRTWMGMLRCSSQYTIHRRW